MKRQYVALAMALAVTVMASAVALGAAAETPAAPGAALDMAGAVKSAGISIAAGLVVGISIVGAGIAVGRIGSAAIGAAAEKPELFFKSLVYVALAEGMAILGIVIAVLIMKQ